MTWTDHLRALGACPSAIEWAASYASREAAWAACDRPDRLLWYAGRVSGPPESPSRRRLVGCLAECAHLALPHYEGCYPDDRSVRDCLDLLGRHAAGDEAVTLAMMRAARAAAYAADAADAARAANREQVLAIVRRWYPQPPAVEGGAQ